MKITAKINSKLLDEEKNILLQLSVSDYISKKRLEEIDKTKEYNIELKEVKSKRSLEQNRLMWAIIHDLVEEIRATDYETDEFKVYIDLLKEANCEYDWIKTPNKATIDKFRDTFRAVEYVRSEVNEHGVTEYVYKVYLGSSKFNVKEMYQLTEIAKKWASEFGLYYD